MNKNKRRNKRKLPSNRKECWIKHVQITTIVKATTKNTFSHRKLQKIFRPTKLQSSGTTAFRGQMLHEDIPYYGTRAQGA